MVISFLTGCGLFSSQKKKKKRGCGLLANQWIWPQNSGLINGNP